MSDLIINATPNDDYLSGIDESISKLNYIMTLMGQVDQKAQGAHVMRISVDGAEGVKKISETLNSAAKAVTSVKNATATPLSVKVKTDEVESLKRELQQVDSLRTGATNRQLRDIRKVEVELQRKLRTAESLRAKEKAIEEERARSTQMSADRESYFAKLQEQYAMARGQASIRSGQSAALAAEQHINSLRRIVAEEERTVARLNALKRAQVNNSGYVPAYAQMADNARAQLKQLVDSYSTPVPIINPSAAMVASAPSAAAANQEAQATSKVAAANNEVAVAKDKATNAGGRLNSQSKKLAETHRELHSAARGASAAVGGLFLTYGNMATLIPAFTAATAVREAIAGFAQFDQAMRSAIAVGQDYSATLAELSNTVKDLSIQFGKMPLEVAKGFQVITAAGFKGREAAALLREALTLSVAGDVDLERAALSLAGAVDVFRTGIGSASHIGAVFAQVSADSVASVESIIEAMKQASAAMSTYNVSVEEFAVMQEKLAKRNIIGSASGTSINNLLMELNSPPSKEAQRLMKEIGVSMYKDGGKVRKDLLTEFLPELQQTLAKYDAETYSNIVKKMVNNRGLKAFTALMESDLKDVSATLEKYRNASATAVVMAHEKQNSVMGDFNKLKAELMTSFIDSGATGADNMRTALQELRKVVASPEFKEGLSSLVILITEVAKAATKLVSAVGGLAGGADSWMGWGVKAAAAITMVIGPMRMLNSMKASKLGTALSNAADITHLNHSTAALRLQAGAAAQAATKAAELGSASAKAAEGAAKVGSGAAAAANGAGLFLRTVSGFARLAGWIGVVMSLADAVYYFYKRSKEGKDLDGDVETPIAQRAKALREQAESMLGTAYRDDKSGSDQSRAEIESQSAKVTSLINAVETIRKQVAVAQTEFDRVKGIPNQVLYGDAFNRLMTLKRNLDVYEKELKNSTTYLNRQVKDYKAEVDEREYLRKAQKTVEARAKPQDPETPMGQGNIHLDPAATGADTVVTVRNPKAGTTITIGGVSTSGNAVGGINIERMLAAVAQTESGNRQFDANGNTIIGPNTKYGRAVGVAQIIPSFGADYARMAGVQWDPQKLYTSKEYGMTLMRGGIETYLKQFGNDFAKALAAYNWGPGNLRKAISNYGDNWLAYAPAETRKYVQKTTASYQGGSSGGYSVPVNLPSQVGDLNITGDDFDKVLGGIQRIYENKERDFEKAQKFAERQVDLLLAQGRLTKSEAANAKAEIASKFTSELVKNDTALANSLSTIAKSKAKTADDQNKLEEALVNVQERLKERALTIQEYDTKAQPWAEEIAAAQKYLEALDAQKLKQEGLAELEAKKAQLRAESLYMTERERFVMEETKKTTERYAAGIQKIVNLQKGLENSGALGTEGGKQVYAQLDAERIGLIETSKRIKEEAEEIANETFNSKKAKEISTRFLDMVFSKDKDRAKKFRDWIMDEVFEKPFRLQIEAAIKPMMEKVAGFLFPQGQGGLLGNVAGMLGLGGSSGTSGGSLGTWIADGISSLFGSDSSGLASAGEAAVAAAVAQGGSSADMLDRVAMWASASQFDPLRSASGQQGGFSLDQVTNLIPQEWKNAAVNWLLGPTSSVGAYYSAATAAASSASIALPTTLAAPAAAAPSFGAALSGSTAAAPATFNAGLAASPASSGMGAAMGAAGTIAAGFMAGMAISGKFSAIGDKPIYAVAAGMAGGAIGAMAGAWAGPIGMAVGAVIGGLVNRAFGHGPKEITGRGISGTLSANANISNYADWIKEGGWFTSDKKGRDIIGRNDGLSSALSEKVRTLSDGIQAQLDVLDLAYTGKAVEGYHTKIDIKANEDGSIDPAKLEAALESFQEGALSFINIGLKDFAKAGEALSATLQRLSASTASASKMLNMMGYNLSQFGTGLAAGANYSSIIEAFGGVEAFEQSTMSFFEEYYTDAEKLEGKKRELERQMGKLNMLVPKTTGEFRLIAESLDLTTAEGRKTYATLLSLAPAFADMTKAQEAYDKQLKELTLTSAAFITDIRNLSDQMRMVALPSINAVTAAVTAVVQPNTDYISTLNTQQVALYNAAVAMGGSTRTNAELTSSLYNLIRGGEHAATITSELALAHLNEAAAGSELRIGLEGLIDPTKTITTAQRELALAFIATFDPLKTARTLLAAAAAPELSAGSTLAALAVNDLRNQILELNRMSVPDYTVQVQAIVDLQAQMVLINEQMNAGLSSQENLQAKLMDVAKQRYDAEAALIKELQGALADAFRTVRSERVAVRDATIGIIGNTPRHISDIRSDIRNTQIPGNIGNLVPNALARVENASKALAAAQTALSQATTYQSATQATAASIQRQRDAVAQQLGTIDFAAVKRISNVLNAGLYGWVRVWDPATGDNGGYTSKYTNTMSQGDYAFRDALNAYFSKGTSAYSPAGATTDPAIIQKLVDNIGAISALDAYIMSFPSNGSLTWTGSDAAYEEFQRIMAPFLKVAQWQQEWMTLNSQLGSANTTTYNAANQTAYQQQVVNQASAEYQAAVKALADARAQLTQNIRQFAADTTTATARLSKLREETVNYYNAQKQLADGMAASAKTLRGAIQQANFQALTPTQQLAELQTQMDQSFVLAMISQGEQLSTAGQSMAQLVPTILDKAKEVYGSGSDYEAIRASVLGMADLVATRLEALTPRDYQQESLAALNEIDTALEAMETGAKNTEAILVSTLQDGTNRNVRGLEGIANILSGRDYDASFFATIPGYATGGFHMGGLRIVGENGPELESTGPSRIWNAHQTRSMLGAGNEELVAEVRELKELAAKQAELIESLLRHQAAANTRAIATQERTAVATEVAAKNAKLEASK